MTQNLKKMSKTLTKIEVKTKCKNKLIKNIDKKH